jgi:hypothetical protein
MSKQKRERDPFEAAEELFEKFRKGFAEPPSSHELRVRAWERWCVARHIRWYFGSWINRDRSNKPFQNEPHEIGHDVGEKILRKFIRKSTIDGIENFAKGEGLPFLIIRGLLPVPLGLAKDEWAHREIAGYDYERVTTTSRRRMRMIDSVLGGILALVGAEAAPRFAETNRKCGVDVSTRWDVQETPDGPIPDMPLRFHQSTVERPLPIGEAKKGDTAQFVAYGAIRNARRLPILLLTVDAIFKKMEEEFTGDSKRRVARGGASTKDAPGKRFDDTIKALETGSFRKEVPRLTRYIRRIGPNTGAYPILATIRDRKAMSFDSALVWVARDEDSMGKEAIRRLREAVEFASRDREKVFRIRLRSRDILIVDNLRAMVARGEERPKLLDVGMLSIFPRRTRWLRQMYGFARGDSGSAGNGSSYATGTAALEPAIDVSKTEPPTLQG